MSRLLKHRIGFTAKILRQFQQLTDWNAYFCSPYYDLIQFVPVFGLQVVIKHEQDELPKLAVDFMTLRVGSWAYIALFHIDPRSPNMLHKMFRA